MIQDAIRKLVQEKHLTTTEAVEVMDEIMSGKATDAQIGAFLVALNLKGETVEEITGCARVMREKVTRIDPGPGPVVDTCGTGGDVSHTFNISTAAAFIVAGAGVKVAKHGNRSVSSKCGSADVLETLGVKLDAPVPVIERCLREARIGFLFAPKLHLAMKFAIGPRREIGIRTVFNLLGPLTNPAGAAHQLMGVFSAAWTEPLANVLKQLGSRHALVVHGLNGLDEISTAGPTRVSELRDGRVTTYQITPESFGIPLCPVERLKVAAAAESAEIIKGILEGKGSPHADIALLNAAAAIYAADAAESMAQGLERARASVRSGVAQTALRRLVEISNG